MEHRIRAAGILLQDNKILLLKVMDETGQYWIPPGGGFEIDDVSTKGCVRRECLEETGLHVRVGELLCVREFLETNAQRYNAEFFYEVTGYQGQPHLDNLKGLNDEETIQAVEWVDITILDSIRTYPADLSSVVSMAKSKQYNAHLGSYIQGSDEETNHLV